MASGGCFRTHHVQTFLARVEGSPPRAVAIRTLLLAQVVVDVQQLKQEVSALREDVELYRISSDHQYEELKALLLGEEPPKALPPRLTSELQSSTGTVAVAASSPSAAAASKEVAAVTPLPLDTIGANGGAGGSGQNASRSAPSDRALQA